MRFKNKKEAVIIPFPTPSNVVSLTERRLRRSSSQILTEVVASESDRNAVGIGHDVAGILVRQVVPIDVLLVAQDQENVTPPDDLIA